LIGIDHFQWMGSGYHVHQHMPMLSLCYFMAALCNRAGHIHPVVSSSLWPPCVADADIIFLPCGFFLSIFFIPRLISAAADWMSTILPHMVWPYLWPPYVIGGPLYFCPVISIFYLSSIFYLFSSPNLSGHRLDLYHTSTHGVAVVRI